MYNRDCILTLTQSARLLGARHVRFCTMNGTDHRSTQEQSREKYARNALGMLTRRQSIRSSALPSSRGFLRHVQPLSARRMRSWRASR